MIAPNIRLCDASSANNTIIYPFHDADDYRPDFDSPSIFCRLLDKDKGGHFSITPSNQTPFTTKQQYLASSNILQTRYIRDEGAVDVVDFFPRPKSTHTVVKKLAKHTPFRESIAMQGELKKWLVRRVECIRGSVDLGQPTSFEILAFLLMA